MSLMHSFTFFFIRIWHHSLAYCMSGKFLEFEQPTVHLGECSVLLHGCVAMTS